MFGDAGGAGVFFYDALDGAGGESSKISRGVDGVEVFGVVEEEGGEGIVADGEVILGGAGGGFGDENRAVFFALATNDELAAVEVDAVAVKPTKFGDAEAAGKEKFDDGTVS